MGLLLLGETTQHSAISATEVSHAFKYAYDPNNEALRVTNIGAASDHGTNLDWEQALLAAFDSTTGTFRVVFATDAPTTGNSSTDYRQAIQANFDPDNNAIRLVTGLADKAMSKKASAEQILQILDSEDNHAFRAMQVGVDSGSESVLKDWRLIVRHVLDEGHGALRYIL